ncbi:hypothetical protein L3Q82_024200, partial [Scortum barcoo]
NRLALQRRGTRGIILEMTEGLRGITISCDDFFLSFALAEEFLQRESCPLLCVEKKKPQIICDYNHLKGSGDNVDKVVGTYSCRRRTSRWPLVLFFNLLDVSTWVNVTITKCLWCPHQNCSSIGNILQNNQILWFYYKVHVTAGAPVLPVLSSLTDSGMWCMCLRFAGLVET